MRKSERAKNNSAQRERTKVEKVNTRGKRSERVKREEKVCGRVIRGRKE